MPHRRSITLFFAGTDTEVGKTYIASLAARYFRDQGLQVGVYKPVASGGRLENGQVTAEDAVELWDAAGRPGDLEHVCPQIFLAPLAPPEAANAEGQTVDPEQLFEGLCWWEKRKDDVTIVEGAGGLMSPLADGLLNIHFAKRAAVGETILVAPNRLGVIHHVLTAVSTAQHYELPIAGIVLSATHEKSDLSCQTNAKQIAQYTHVPVIGEVPWDGTQDDVRFLSRFLNE